MHGYTKPKKISLKNHPEFSESWVQNIIAEDPSVLGLGNLVLRDRERVQPKAGRLDLLLQDADTDKRYEVELQLGSTDETHIIRTIEYWDVERRRYPQYEHSAVLIAEDVTSRFLNVVGLFNGAIPIIAIQMEAYEVGDHVTLVFTKVMDEFERGLVDEDEDAISAPTDRNYWENGRGTKKTVKLADQILKLADEFNDSLELKYNKFYIGISRNGQAFNFIAMRPKKQFLGLEIKLPKTETTDALIEEAGIQELEYNKRYQSYRLNLHVGDAEKHGETLKQLLKLAYDGKTN